MEKSAWRSFLRRVFGVFVAKGVIFLCGIVASVISARALGVEGRGVFGAAQALGSIGAQFMNLGFHSAGVFMLSKDPSKKDQIWGNIIMLSVSAAGVSALIYAAAQYLTQITISGPVLVLACASIPIMLYSMLQQNLFIGLKKVAFYNAMEIIISVTYPALLLITSLLWVQTPTSAYSLGIAGQIAACCAGVYFMRRHLDAVPRPCRKTFYETLPFGVKAYAASLLSFLVIRSGILIVSGMLGDEQTGLYSVAVSLSDIIMMLPAVLGLILFPEAAAMRSDKEQYDFMKKTLCIFSILMAVIVSAAALLSRLVIGTLYGAEFISSSDVFIILMPGAFFMALQSILSNYFAAKNMWTGNIITPLFGFTVNITLNFALIPLYGISGAAFSSVTAYLVMFLCMLTRFVINSRKVRSSEGTAA